MTALPGDTAGSFFPPFMPVRPRAATPANEVEASEPLPTLDTALSPAETAPRETAWGGSGEEEPVLLDTSAMPGSGVSDADEDLMPWDLGASPSDVPASAGLEDATGGGDLDDLPWLERPGEPAGGAPEISSFQETPQSEGEGAGAPGGVPSWLTTDADAAGEEEPAASYEQESSLAARVDDVLAAGDFGAADAAPAGVAWESTDATGAQGGSDISDAPLDLVAVGQFSSEETRKFTPPGSTSAAPNPLAAVDAASLHGRFDDVAERLERIAVRLRENPVDLLTGAGSVDPLELLVTGFVMGYAQRRRSS